MRFIEWIKNVYEGEAFLFAVTAFAVGVLVVAAMLAWILNDGDVYNALAAMAGGGFGLILLSGKGGVTAGGVSISLFLIFGGCVALFLRGSLTFRRKKRERKRRRAEIARRLQYTLPERENGFIRTRLNTVLSVKEKEDDTGERVGKPVTLEHARALLSKVKAAPLTMAERLQFEELERTFALYIHKEDWMSEDLRAVNDLFSMLLKLSAKYAV